MLKQILETIGSLLFICGVILFPFLINISPVLTLSIICLGIILSIIGTFILE